MDDAEWTATPNRSTPGAGGAELPHLPQEPPAYRIRCTLYAAQCVPDDSHIPLPFLVSHESQNEVRPPGRCCTLRASQFPGGPKLFRNPHRYSLFHENFLLNGYVSLP